MVNSQLRSEIAEQPQALARVFTQSRHIQQIATHINNSQPRYVVIAARGTSDNAARYAQYLFGIVLGWPVALATPALGTLYHADMRYDHALVIGISQSGRSPDICDVIERARACGAVTVAITNSPTSRLATAAAHHIDICAGAELSVAATKSYTNQLLSIAVLAQALSNNHRLQQAIETVPAMAQQSLSMSEAHIQQAAHILGTAPAAMSVGRGLQYATAYEAALKIKELSGLPVEAYSAADVLHGPVTVVERGFPVLISSDTGATRMDTLQLLDRLRQHAAQLLIASNDPAICAYADVALTTPDCDEFIAPIITILPWQRVAHATAAYRGRDADHPLGLQKITETR